MKGKGREQARRLQGVSTGAAEAKGWMTVDTWTDILLLVYWIWTTGDDDGLGTTTIWRLEEAFGFDLASSSDLLPCWAGGLYSYQRIYLHISTSNE
jgi:hypothetical protein